jgi:hypothetical protein
LPPRAGGRLDRAYLPSTSVVHLGGESAKSVSPLCAGRQISALQAESELLYMRKHFGRRGLCSHVLLVMLGDIILAAKDLLRGRGPAFAFRHFHASRLTWRLARSTAWGLTSHPVAGRPCSLASVLS